MNPMIRNALLATALLVAIAAASGCARHVSRDISPDGVAGTVVFPERERALLRDGTYPTWPVVGQIGPGVSKDQLYAMLGRPHFREGFNAREWDYILNFRQGDVVRSCQYKVIFDSEMRGRSFHWLPADCAQLGGAGAAATAATGVDGARVHLLEASGLFAFDKATVNDLTAQGRAELDRIAGELKAAPQVRDIEIQAHTDLLGSQDYNFALSQARANAVREHLVAAGVQPALVRAIGMGKGHPVKTCDTSLPRQALIDCLAPNRRVQIRASVGG